MHKIWWLWIPLIGLLIQAVIEINLNSHRLADLHSEQGPHETLQAILLFFALLTAVAGFWKSRQKALRWMAAWCGFAALCCLYVLGEEISWGQHIWQWSTPEYWVRINDQGETNLHNTSSWLDQKPRLLLLLGVVVGGLVIPAMRRFCPARLPERFAKNYPPEYLAFTAFCALAIKIIDSIDDQLSDVIIMERASEVEELYLFYFVLLYLLTLYRRIAQA